MKINVEYHNTCFEYWRKGQEVPTSVYSIFLQLLGSERFHGIISSMNYRRLKPYWAVEAICLFFCYYSRYVGSGVVVGIGAITFVNRVLKEGKI